MLDTIIAGTASSPKAGNSKNEEQQPPGASDENVSGFTRRRQDKGVLLVGSENASLITSEKQFEVVNLKNSNSQLLVKAKRGGVEDAGAEEAADHEPPLKKAKIVGTAGPAGQEQEGGQVIVAM